MKRAGYYNDSANVARWSLMETTAPAAEPVSTANAKEHLRVTHTDEDTYIGGLVSVAREWCEEYTGRSFINRTYTMYFEETPKERSIELVRPPLSSVTHIKYYDADNVLQTWASSNYRVDTQSKPGRVTLVSGISWPSIIDDRSDGLQIAYVAGYGANATNVPTPIIHAIKMLVMHWYMNRESVAVGTITKEIEMGVKSLLSPYKQTDF